MDLDIENLADGLDLPTELSTDIWEAAAEASVVMKVASETELAGVGESVPVIDEWPEAEMLDTPNEPGAGSQVKFGTKIIKPRRGQVKILIPRRVARNAKRLYSRIEQKLPLALAKNFDRHFLFRTPVNGWDSLQGVDTQSVKAGANAAAYKGVTAALGAIAGAGGDANAVILTPTGEVNFLDQMDGNDRPIFIQNGQTEGQIGSLLARPAHKSRHADNGDNTVGFIGDWTRAHWGVVRDSISVKASTEAAVTMGSTEIVIDLGDDEEATATVPNIVTPYDRDLVVMICEAEYGIAHEGDEYFRRLTV